MICFVVRCGQCGAVCRVGRLGKWRCPKDPTHTPVHVKET